MLILTRQTDQVIKVETPCGSMTIKIIEVAQVFDGARLKYPRVKIGIDAPANFYIIREELLDG